jgi:hypothetical protein
MAGHRTGRMSRRDGAHGLQPRVFPTAEGTLLRRPEANVGFAKSFDIFHGGVIVGHENDQCVGWGGFCMEAYVVSVGDTTIVCKVLSTQDDDAWLGRAGLRLPSQRKPLVAKVGQFREAISGGIRKVQLDRARVSGKPGRVSCSQLWIACAFAMHCQDLLWSQVASPSSKTLLIA